MTLIKLVYFANGPLHHRTGQVRYGARDLFAAAVLSKAQMKRYANNITSSNGVFCMLAYRKTGLKTKDGRPIYRLRDRDIA